MSRAVLSLFVLAGIFFLYANAQRCPSNEEFSPCKKGCELICVGRGATKSGSCNSRVCRPGCNCKTGFARTKGKCVAADSCP